MEPVRDLQRQQIEDNVAKEVYAYLPLEFAWYDEIKMGRKTIEFRRPSNHWMTRITGRTHCVFQRGPLAGVKYLGSAPL